MLDTVSLRVAFAAVALTMMVLFYFVTYRSTRSSYAGWWCAALAVFLGGSALYLLNGTDHQWWANPLANVATLLGAACIWAGAGSLRQMRARWWQLAPVPLLVGIVSLFDDPSSNVWSGGSVFLPGMALLIALASWELWQLARETADYDRDEAHLRIVHSLAVVSGLVALFYAGRGVAFVVVGQHADLFRIYFGTQVTTLLTTVLLALVSFSMSSLSTEQQTRELRTRATRDGLTGLLNRGEFLRRAARTLRHSRRAHMPAALILADLDHFKAINDRYGHAAGDRALQAFASACRSAVRSGDLVGRYGGEEFILLLPETPIERAEAVVSTISHTLREIETTDSASLPTVSYGIAMTDHRVGLEPAIAAADAALYQAKQDGRDRSVIGESLDVARV